jgi:hypothetical protein
MKCVANLLLHVVDISPRFEEQISAVNQTLRKFMRQTSQPGCVQQNDAYSYVPKDEDDLSPRQKGNLTLEVNCRKLDGLQQRPVHIYLRTIETECRSLTAPSLRYGPGINSRPV